MNQNIEEIEQVEKRHPNSRCFECYLYAGPTVTILDILEKSKVATVSNCQEEYGSASSEIYASFAKKPNTYCRVWTFRGGSGIPHSRGADSRGEGGWAPTYDFAKFSQKLY